MTNKYKYFVANWKMFGDIKTINSINKVIKISKSRKYNKALESMGMILRTEENYENLYLTNFLIKIKKVFDSVEEFMSMVSRTEENKVKHTK